MTTTIKTPETPTSEVVAEALNAIYVAHGELTAELVVSEASAPNHPLHHLFTWDDGEAARQWRLEQGRRVIRSVRYKKTGGEVRAFHNISYRKGYERIDRIVRVKKMRDDLITQFRNAADAFVNRWRRHEWAAEEFRAWVLALADELR